MDERRRELERSMAVRRAMAGGRDAPAVEELRKATYLSVLTRIAEALERIGDSLELSESGESRDRGLAREMNSRRATKREPSTTNATELRKRSAKARRSRNADDE